MARAPGAHFTDLALRFLEARESPHLFQDDKDFQTFERWILEKVTG